MTTSRREVIVQIGVPLDQASLPMRGTARAGRQAVDDQAVDEQAVGEQADAIVTRRRRRSREKT